MGAMADRAEQGQGAGEQLVVVKRDPFNAETPPAALSEIHTPTPNFYVRSNFRAPQVSGVGWRLAIGGAVERPVEVALDELRSMPSREIVVTLECAGNGRTGFAPLPQGEPWGWGAVSTARWRGVPLAHLLEAVGPRRTAVEVLFEGADRGVPSGGGEAVPFGRSLPVDKALHPDVLLAYEMNGEALPVAHGGPVRLLVPGWYGMASVKWLASITALEEPYGGFYQRQRYVYDYPDGSAGMPVSTILPRAMIVSPGQGQSLRPGRHVVAGMAWSGEGPVAGVEVSVEGGGAWQAARLVGEAAGPYAWRRWEFDWDAARLGRHVLRARAIDAKGNVQPDLARWNRLGYGNNGVQPVIVEVVE